MKNLTVDQLRKDLSFLDKGITLSNTSKKNTHEKYISGEKRPKKQKNL